MYNKVVFNLGTQEDYWHHRASYDAIEKTLEKMRKQADEEGISSIACPSEKPYPDEKLKTRLMNFLICSPCQSRQMD